MAIIKDTYFNMSSTTSKDNKINKSKYKGSFCVDHYKCSK